MLLGRVMLFRAEHPSKVLCSIVVTLLGIETLVMPLQ